jgi:hypothetical protein
MLALGTAGPAPASAAACCTSRPGPWACRSSRWTALGSVPAPSRPRTTTATGPTRCSGWQTTCASSAPSASWGHQVRHAAATHAAVLAWAPAVNTATARLSGARARAASSRAQHPCRTRRLRPAGGGPFAAAAARFMPSERIQALGLVCPFAGPVESTRGMCLANKLLLRAAVHWPGLARALWRLSGRVMAWDPDCIRRFTLHPADRWGSAGCGCRSGGGGAVGGVQRQHRPSARARARTFTQPGSFTCGGNDWWRGWPAGTPSCSSRTWCA